MDAEYAVIVGSGFGDFAGTDEGLCPDTRFGEPSSPIRERMIGSRAVLTIARHGDGHTIPPHRINYRANLLALADCGVRRVIALNTVGVISTIREPGQIAIPEQLIDYTWGREHTIYDGSDGIVTHIEFTEPLSRALGEELAKAADRAGIDCLHAGIYATTQGPRLESAAEVQRLQRDGADYVGMTAMPEAALAMELGLDYTCIALIVNKAAGLGDKPIHDDVESSSLATKSLTIRLLEQFFAGG